MSSSSLSSSSSEESPSVAAAACATSDRWVKLLPRWQNTKLSNNKNGYRLRIEVSDYCNIEPEIFRYFRKVTNGTPEDICTGVCSWADMVHWPINEPRDGDTPPTYRLSYMDAVFPTRLVAESVWAVFQEEVNALVAAANLDATIVTDTEATLSGTL